MSACVIAQVCLRIFSHMVMFDCESQFGCVSFHNTAESHSVSIQLTDSEIHTPHRSNVHCHCTYYVKRSMYRKTDKKAPYVIEIVAKGPGWVRFFQFYLSLIKVYLLLH